MKKKRKIVGSIILAIIFISTFSFYLTSTQTKQLKTIYEKSLVKIFENISGSSNTLEYIAIDLDTLKGLDDTEKKEVIIYFEEKYKLPIIDASYTDLLETGMEKRNKELSGILLYVEKIENHIININVHVAKEYGSSGGNGITVKFRYKNGEWIIWNVKHNWIS